MFKRVSLMAVLSAVLWPSAVSAQWLPATQSTTESISRTGPVGLGGNPNPHYPLTIRGNTTGTANNGIFFQNFGNSAFELSEASNNSPAIHLHNYMEGFIRFQIAWIEMMRMLPNGNIGVRTPTPLATLHVNGSATALRIDTPNGLPVVFRDLLGTEGYGSGTMLDMSTGNSMIKVSDLRVGNLGMPEINSTNAPLVLNADSDYDVQVGTDENPRGLVVKGNIAAKFQDVAEWVPTTADLAAGTVVVLDPVRSNHVLASSRAYDTTVAGVISPQPGIILGEAGPSKALVATTGRVRVRVDATAQPIAIGDLLVTSDKSGVAMKSVAANLQGIAIHRPGTVLGKALEPLPGGTGEILVLLSLQ